jgi:2'-5' RNA ligase
VEVGPAPAFSQRDATGPFTTLVAFMPEGITDEIARLVQRLPDLGGHFRYPPAQIHMTVRNLDGVQPADLPNILSRVPPIKLRTARLCFTPETLLLQLAPIDRTLRSLRTQLDELPGARPPARVRPKLAFANVLRLNGPVSSELRIGVRRAREELEGRSVEVRDLQLVSTDKVGSPDRTQILGRYVLAGTGA